MIIPSDRVKGHAAAAFTVLVWGSTFVSTKVLLVNFAPVEIILLRFIIGFVFLCLAAPGGIGKVDRKTEALFALAGLCGVTLNYLLETYALQYTKASNLAVIVSVTPLIVGITASIIYRERIKANFIVGFLLSVTGIFLISFADGSEFSFHLRGDMLGLSVSVVWTVYTVASEKLSKKGYNVIHMTRRIFFYGILFMIPFAIREHAVPNFEQWAEPRNLLLLLYLGIAACALSYITWNYAVRVLGPIRSNLYFYASPLITVLFSVLILNEVLSPRALVGMMFTLLGVGVSGDLIGNIRTMIDEKKRRKR